jgi:hypothetical protein
MPESAEDYCDDDWTPQPAVPPVPAPRGVIVKPYPRSIRYGLPSDIADLEEDQSTERRPILHGPQLLTPALLQSCHDPDFELTTVPPRNARQQPDSSRDEDGARSGDHMVLDVPPLLPAFDCPPGPDSREEIERLRNKPFLGPVEPSLSAEEQEEIREYREMMDRQRGKPGDEDVEGRAHEIAGLADEGHGSRQSLVPGRQRFLEEDSIVFLAEDGDDQYDEDAEMSHLQNGLTNSDENGGAVHFPEHRGNHHYAEDEDAEMYGFPHDDDGNDGAATIFSGGATNQPEDKHGLPDYDSDYWEEYD